MGELLIARRTSFWRSQYEITADGVALATWTGGVWEREVPFRTGGAWYAVATHRMGSDCELRDEPGGTVATLAGIGTRTWTLELAHRTVRFERTAWYRHDRAAFDGDAVVGGIRLASGWKADAVAELPGLDRPVQVFALMVFLQNVSSSGDAGDGGGDGGDGGGGGGGE